MELTEPPFRQAPPEMPAFTQDIEISFKPNDTGALVWMMNNQSFRANYVRSLSRPPKPLISSQN
jgi:hypothetical protein